MKIYVATSWRNKSCDDTVEFLRKLGHEVYDFRQGGFAWEEMGLSRDSKLSAAETAALLEHPRARAGFEQDMAALRACDACVLVLPCGRSAHLEAGWAAGAGRVVVVYQPQQPEPPELMHGMAGVVVGALEDVAVELAQTPPSVARYSGPGPMPEVG